MTEPTDFQTFSLIVEAQAIPPSGRRYKMAAKPAEAAALARYLDLLALDHLEGEFALRRLAKDRIEIEGRLIADLTQSCVLTLAPVAARIETEFRRLFSEAADPRGEDESEIDLSFDAVDPPEALPEGGIDLGAILIEELSLALDPYPRAPGAEWSGGSAASGDGESSPAPAAESLEPKHPFEILKKFKDRT